MKSKQSVVISIIFLPAKNIRTSWNRIIQPWISMMLAGICTATAGVAAVRVDGGAVQKKAFY
ncbi:MAG TPA: hypothetical protein VMW53_09120 [archaeon]|nr:hypothetical protein [archaeon]